MPLSAPTNVYPDSHSGLGFGVVDVDLGLTTAANQAVSWQINGQSPMNYYQIQIYQNDALSTLCYSSGKVQVNIDGVHVAYGRDPYGEVNRFVANDISAAALSGATTPVVNGYANGYKMVITQWWGTNSERIRQTNPSFFYTRTTPTLTISNLQNPLTQNYYTFNGAYTQAEGDAIAWIRWEIALQGQEDTPFYDSGHVTGTQKMQVSFNRFRDGYQYAIRLTVQTELGMVVTTGWQNFDVSYTTTASTNTLSVCQITGTSQIRLQWGNRQLSTTKWFRIYRTKVIDGEESPLLEYVAPITYKSGKTQYAIYDCTAKSGVTYRYYMWELRDAGNGAGIFSVGPTISQEITPQFQDWYLLECERSTSTYDIYHVTAEYRFSVNVENGAFSNNNAPALFQNFTRYPNHQATSSNYLSGSLSGFIGYVDMNNNEYVNDTASLAEALDALSTSRKPKFIKSRKGELWKVELSGAVTKSLGDKYPQQPYKATIPWVQTGSATDVSLIITTEDDLFPGDQVYYTKVDVDPVTGILSWTTPNGYVGGSTLSLVNGGESQKEDLRQTYDGSFEKDTLQVVDDYLFATKAN